MSSLCGSGATGLFGKPTATTIPGHNRVAYTAVELYIFRTLHNSPPPPMVSRPPPSPPPPLISSPPPPPVWCAPGASASELVDYDCSIEPAVTGVTMHYRTSVTFLHVQVQAQGTPSGWIGLGFASSMFGATAVIGLPDDSTVKLYRLGGYSAADVTVLPDQSDLEGASLEKVDQVLKMSFRMRLPTAGGPVAITTDGSATPLIFARGPAAHLSYHQQAKTQASVVLSTRPLPPSVAPPPLVSLTPPPPPPPPAPSLCSSSSSVYASELVDYDCSIEPAVAGVTMHYRTSVTFLHVQVQAQGTPSGWIGLGFASSMFGATAVIGLPDDSTVKLYRLGGYSAADVTVLPDQSDLEGASLEKVDQVLKMSFRMRLPTAGGPVAITTDGSATPLIFARGPAAHLSYHGPSFRTQTSVVLSPATRPPPPSPPPPSLPPPPPTGPPPPPSPTPPADPVGVGDALATETGGVATGIGVGAGLGVLFLLLTGLLLWRCMRRGKAHGVPAKAVLVDTISSSTDSASADRKASTVAVPMSSFNQHAAPPPPTAPPPSEGDHFSAKDYI